MRERMWELYELAYRRTAEATPTHELLYRHEFDELLADPTNRLWVLWDDAAPVASTLIATDITSTRYLSGPWFERHHPERARRSLVHYIMWVVVHPAHAATGALVRLARETLAVEAAEGALLVFDAPEINQPSARGGLAEMMRRLATMVAERARVDQITVQRYYAVDFPAGAHGAPARDLELAGGERVVAPGELSRRQRGSAGEPAPRPGGTAAGARTSGVDSLP